MTQEVLNRLAQQTQGSAALVVAEADECIVVKSASFGAEYLKINYQVGSRHPIGVSASGLAVAISFPPQPDESAEVKQARELGYGFSEGKFQAGAKGYFLPLPHRHMAIGIVTLRDPDPEEVLAAIREAITALG